MNRIYSHYLGQRILGTKGAMRPNLCVFVCTTIAQQTRPLGRGIGFLGGMKTIYLTFIYSIIYTKHVFFYYFIYYLLRLIEYFQQQHILMYILECKIFLIHHQATVPLTKGLAPSSQTWLSFGIGACLLRVWEIKEHEYWEQK